MTIVNEKSNPKMNDAERKALIRKASKDINNQYEKAFRMIGKN
jgi:hypothetical protein